ncbi:pilus (MSHA type) biogenesis protein MshL [Oceanobacter mangrovi]|uniref:pilus (MSHA type) biogenesis protein MshL n=1 Tax=Oceanobacter mangrovi TaxID=2862510 RepID=UPI001C8EAAAA|nr:pilus (MSHA type) biogenesis protein MshL [Oceanobacter mangrovi]
MMARGQNKQPVWQQCLLALLIMALAGCSQQPTHKEMALVQQPMLPEPPATAMSRPQPPAADKAVAAPTVSETEYFDVVADNTPVAAFFNSLVTGTGVNLILHPEVEGTISLSLRHVTLADVLEAVRDIYGFDFRINSYGVQILPSKQQTRIYPINYLNVTRSGRSGMQVSSGQVSQAAGQSSSSNSSTSGSNSTNVNSRTINSTEVETDSLADFWQQLGITLQLLVQDEANAKVVVDAHAGIAIVKASPVVQQSVNSYLQRAQISIQQQVLIETKILEVTLSDGYQQGINWDALVSSGSREATFGQTSVALDNSDRIGGIFSLNLSAADFAGAVELLQSQGDVKVLSSPRIATVNNQKAVIKVGSDEFFVTNVSTTTTTTTTGSTQSPDIELTPFFSGIALDVTPQVSSDEEVILHVHPTVTEVEERTKTIELGSDEFNLPLAYSTVRETDSIIRAKSGQVVVIGGLMQNRLENTEAKVPLLGDIPVLGWLFRQQRQEKVQSELVILIQPRIVDGATPLQEVEAINRRFSRLAPSFLKTEEQDHEPQSRE